MDNQNQNVVMSIDFCDCRHTSSISYLILLMQVTEWADGCRIYDLLFTMLINIYIFQCIWDNTVNPFCNV